MTIHFLEQPRRRIPPCFCMVTHPFSALFLDDLKVSRLEFFVEAVRRNFLNNLRFYLVSKCNFLKLLIVSGRFVTLYGEEYHNSIQRNFQIRK